MLASFLIPWPYTFPVQFLVLPGILIMAFMTWKSCGFLLNGVERTEDIDAAVPFYREARYFGMAMSLDPFTIPPNEYSRRNFGKLNERIGAKISANLPQPSFSQSVNGGGPATTAENRQ